MPRDPLHDPGPSHLHWSTDNVGEAAPGVQTPLSGSLWQEIGDAMPRAAAHAMGVLSRAERDDPSDAAVVARVFYGRLAMQMEFLARLGDRVPGTTGHDAVLGIHGEVPDEMTFAPTRRRYPFIAAKLPVAFATSPRLVRALAAETDAWWRAELPRLDGLDRADAIAAFGAARTRYVAALTTHTLGLLSSVQPLYDALSKLVARTGVGDVGVLGGSGGAEMAIISDIWAASRGRAALDDVVRNHGFHGPLEGELSSRVWREDPAPLERLIAEYTGRDEAGDPAQHAREQQRRAAAMRAELLAALPSAQRPAARVLLGLAVKRLPLRGVGKRAFLQAFDVCRGAARRAGECLARDGVLAEPDDVFYLTSDELAGALGGDVRALVAERRTRHAEYQRLVLPASWCGVPEPVVATSAAERNGVVTGIGVSAGIAEGLVRVVTDPAFADVEPDEVLVAPTTDPSWSSIMFLSAALVVDIGGPLSHAAVVARELGLPCVVNTRDGTRALRTGDRVRVDGSSGRVEILEHGA